MRDHMERFVVLPFSVGCASQSSIAVVATRSDPKKPKPELKPPVTSMRSLFLSHLWFILAFGLTEIFFFGLKGRQEGEESTYKEKMKNAFGLLVIPKPNISSGIQKLIRSIKNLSQVFGK